ncbi:hypothetical protein [Kosakonia sp. R1.Fl]|nr:hypothetical protein [Kosakonia sp. R1.Fl]
MKKSPFIEALIVFTLKQLFIALTLTPVEYRLMTETPEIAKNAWN